MHGPHLHSRHSSHMNINDRVLPNQKRKTDIPFLTIGYSMALTIVRQNPPVVHSIYTLDTTRDITFGDSLV